MIKLRDRSTVVSYLQIYLKSYYPKPVILGSDDSVSYYNNKELRVTGTYDIQTYLCLSCYMANLYPKEGFPYYYVLDEEDHLVKVQYGEKDPSTGIKKTLTEILDYNLGMYLKIPESYNIDDRVMSYIFEEVVSERSSEDEVFRIQKLIYGDKFVPKNIIGDYSSIKGYITSVQKDRIEYGGLYNNYKDFKVTGYCDPWTERLLKEGVK